MRVAAPGRGRVGAGDDANRFPAGVALSRLEPHFVEAKHHAAGGRLGVESFEGRLFFGEVGINLLRAKPGFLFSPTQAPLQQDLAQAELSQRCGSSVESPGSQKPAVPECLRIKSSGRRKIAPARVFPQNGKSCNTSGSRMASVRAASRKELLAPNSACRRSSSGVTRRGSKWLRRQTVVTRLAPAGGGRQGQALNHGA